MEKDLSTTTELGPPTYPTQLPLPILGVCFS